MKKYVLLSVLAISSVFTTNLFSAYNVNVDNEYAIGLYNNESKDINLELISNKSLDNDTVFFAKRLGNEIRFLLAENGDFQILLNEQANMIITSEGNLGFGNTNPQYKLDVCGGIRASEELIIEANEWCDFVFNEDYYQEDFSTRMKFIYENKHLPYILPEKQIVSDGIPVTETLTGLLRNVEELYLYIEKLEERVNLLEEENKNLKSQK